MMHNVHDLPDNDLWVMVDPEGLRAEARRIPSDRFERASGWNGHVGTAEAITRTQTGDEALARRSDEMLAKLEDLVPRRPAFETIDDVVGAVPNIGAFLAGNPMSMRRREKFPKENAPITIFMDLSSSAMISAESVLKRGITLLALVRMLSQHRAVELWVGSGYGTSTVGRRGRTDGKVCMAWRIDTTPLDLARAAHMIASTSMTRALAYTIYDTFYKGTGAWGWDSERKHRTQTKTSLEAIFPGNEVLYIPAIHGHDDMVDRPEVWLKQQMAKYTKHDEDEEA